jgi:hypothetical protein
MKRICLLTATIALATVAFNVPAGVQGTVNFKFTALFQDVVNKVTNTTHVASSVTNVQQISLSTTTNAAINNNTLLRMLANSFNTNFPPGAALKLNEFGHVVVAVGTNIVLSASNVLAINVTTNGVFSDNLLSQAKFTSTTNTAHVVTKETVNDAASVDYDDSLLSTRDGNTTRFSARGLVTQHAASSVNNGIGTQSQTLVFSGSGSGSISNSISQTQFVLRGGFAAGLTYKFPSP